MPQPRILIVGAGIAGMAVARALALRGLRADVVERNSQWQQSGAGLYLPANAVRALGLLELGEEVAARSGRIVRQRTLDHRGKPLLEIVQEELWGDVGDSRAISRNDLHEVLRAAVDPAWVRLGVGVSAVDDAGTVTFADGSTESYDVVIGADGIGSAVRDSAFSGIQPRFLGQICWRFLVEGVPEIPDWTVRLGSGGRAFLTVQLGGGRVYCYADVNSAEPVRPEGDWRTHFADFTHPVPELLAQGADAYFAPLMELDGSDWTRPAVVLIGDAAHACSPNMAQGGAMALEDALVLAEVLADLPVDQALPAYQARRVGRIDWVLAQNHRRDKARGLPVPIRNAALRLVGKRLFTANHAGLLALP